MRRCKWGVVNYLLKLGANIIVNFLHPTSNANTALSCCCYAERYADALILLDLGAVINASNGPTAPLLGACREPWRPGKSDRGWTAVNRTRKKLLQRLFAAGANMEARDINNATPLICAAQFGDLTASTLLISRGANRNAVDNYGLTAFQVTCLRQADPGAAEQQFLIADLHLRHGADPNRTIPHMNNRLNVSTLYGAFVLERFLFCDYLLRHNAHFQRGEQRNLLLHCIFHRLPESMLYLLRLHDRFGLAQVRPSNLEKQGCRELAWNTDNIDLMSAVDTLP
jgi:ankyrin repeat protein